jgi:hypothetical protein
MKIVITYERELNSQELDAHNRFVEQQLSLGNEVWEFGGGTKNPKPRN